MIYSTLAKFTDSLSNHLKLSFQLQDDIVLLSSLDNHESKSASNKIIVSLVNVERETSGGIRFNYQNINTNQYKKGYPPWQLNLYVLVAAIFADKQYIEGLQLLSGILEYLQSNTIIGEKDLHTSLTLEPVNLSFNELSNLWSICGSTYHPSILCKIRIINVDIHQISRIEGAIQKQIIKDE